MKLRDAPALTFDDVLLVPRRSHIASRSGVNTSTRLTPGITMKTPIVSANMDTVTEAEMAIAMARSGGIGIIHRFMTVERQAAEVARVKRAESFVVEHPAVIGPEATLHEASQLLASLDVGGLVVVEAGKLAGMLTTRDLLFAPNPEAHVREAMTPASRLVTAREGARLDDARRLLHQHRLEKLPLVDEAGNLCGLITAQDIVKLEQHPDATKDSKGRLRIGAAVGARPADLERAAACLKAGADVLVVDIAHGHSDLAIEMIRALKREFPRIEVAGGNVATAQGVRDLAQAGADAVKVGVGSGSICITRVVTGFGVPQLTAISDCAEAAHSLGVPLIADGGIRSSGDIVKALAAGASSVMVGSLLAGTDESPGASVVREGRRFKIVRGMASLSANVDRREIEAGIEVDPADWERVVPEGVEAVVPHRGRVADILYQLVGGIRSGFSYAGVCGLEELWANAEFLRMTPAGMAESKAHDVDRI